jgi:hypothetical protein
VFCKEAFLKASLQNSSRGKGNEVSVFTFFRYGLDPKIDPWILVAPAYEFPPGARQTHDGFSCSSTWAAQPATEASSRKTTLRVYRESEVQRSCLGMTLFTENHLRLEISSFGEIILCGRGVSSSVPSRPVTDVD